MIIFLWVTPLFVRDNLRLLQANLYGSRRLFLPPRPALTFCFRIVLKPSRLISRNLDDVCFFCSSVRLFRANFAQILQFSKYLRIMSPILSRLTCSWFSINVWVIQWSMAFCNCLCTVCSRRWNILQCPSMRWSIICINSLKPCGCWCSCFPEFETKLEVCPLLHNDEEKHSTHGATTDDNWVITFFSLIHRGLKLNWHKLATLGLCAKP